MTRRRRDLLRIHGVERVERTRGGHVRLILVNGRTLITSGSPSDWRSTRNTQARVRRSTERRVAVARKAGTLAAQSPLHHCRRPKS
jgi:hypothetical protein